MRQNRRFIIIFIIVIVVLGGSALAAYLFTLKQQADQAAQEDAGQLVEHPAEITSDEADKLAYEGDVEKGVEAYDQAISSTEDPFTQFIFYSRKATLLFNNKEYDGALEAALQAHSLQETSDSAAFVGQIAREKGDKALALEYYKKAVTLIELPDPLAEEDKKYYEQVIRELESGA